MSLKNDRQPPLFESEDAREVWKLFCRITKNYRINYGNYDRNELTPLSNLKRQCACHYCEYKNPSTITSVYHKTSYYNDHVHSKSCVWVWHLNIQLFTKILVAFAYLIYSTMGCCIAGSLISKLWCIMLPLFRHFHPRP